MDDLAERVEEYQALGLREVLVAEVRLPKEGSTVAAKLSELLDRTAALPGVKEAAVVDVLPGAVALRHQAQIQREGLIDTMERTDFLQVVSPEYFKILELDLIQGRVFTPTDSDSGVHVAVVNESYARQGGFVSRDNDFLSALGKRIRTGEASMPWITIVGVVENGSKTRDVPEVYVPYSQASLLAATPSWYLLVRTTGDQEDVAAELQRALGLEFQTLEERLRGYL